MENFPKDVVIIWYFCYWFKGCLILWTIWVAIPLFCIILNLNYDVHVICFIFIYLFYVFFIDFEISYYFNDICISACIT